MSDVMLSSLRSCPLPPCAGQDRDFFVFGVGIGD